MKVRAEKTILLTDSVDGIQEKVKVKGQEFGRVNRFKYLGAVVSDEGSTTVPYKN